MPCRYICQERKSILVGKKLKLPNNITVSEHFTDLIQQGVINGDGPALVGDGGKVLWTPNQLDETANKFAKAMRRLLGYWTNNNPEGDLVIGFCLHTTENVVVIMLAILKLGGTYFCLSPNYPEQQIIKLVDISRPLLIITESDPQILSRFDCVKHICEIAPLYEIIDNSGEFSGDPNDPVPLEHLSPPWRRSASIVITAGTTGEPKFVRIGHMAILNRVYWQYKAIPYHEDEIACLSSLLVDVESISEIFSPLLKGVPLYIIPRHIMAKIPDLLDKIQEIQITRINMTPSFLNCVFNEIELEKQTESSKAFLDTLKFITISGDTLTEQAGLKLFALIPHCHLVYFYGATETMSEATWELYSDEESFKEKSHDSHVHQISTGRPLANTTVYIMDEDLNIVPEGTIGEICISGKCLAMGYLNNKDTSQSFVQYPPQVKKSSQIKLFRTGDYGKVISNDGRRLYYEGRIDMIIKFDGKEIELSSVAVAVENTGMCKECAVLCFHRNLEDQAAVAFCIMKEGLKREDLEESLRKVLEDFMLPDIYPVAELPYLPNGKLDRQKLLKIYKFRRMENTPEDWKALNLGHAEKQAAKVLFEAISHTIGISLRLVMSNYESSFWSIGGTSINVLQIVHSCRENGYLISIDEFVLADTLALILKAMVHSSKFPVSGNKILLHICDLAEWKYETCLMANEHKTEVIRIISQSYKEKGILSILLGLTSKDYTNYLEILWSSLVKEDLGIIAFEKQTGKIAAVAINMDVNTSRGSFFRKKIDKPMMYLLDLHNAIDTIIRKTTIANERGKILHIFMMCTDPSVEARFNVVLIEYLLKCSMQRALYKGFSWVLIQSASTLIRDLCGSLLQYDLIAEIKLNSFVAKDKTKPFRSARDYQSFRAYYRLFT